MLTLPGELLSDVGQVGNLRPIGNRPGAGPGKILRSSSQPSLHRISFNIANDPLKLGLGPNQPIITLVLPKRTPSKAEYFVALPSSKPLERLHCAGNIHQRSHQEMHVVRHDYVRVQLELSQIAILNRFHNDIRDFRPLEKQRTSASVIKNVINGDECLSGSGFGREASIRWQTPVQSPSEKYWMPNSMKVRQPPPMDVGHKQKVDLNENILNLHSYSYVGQVDNLRPIGNRPVNNFLIQRRADYQSAAGYQPAPQQQLEWLELV